jgi:hypothetical protein
MLCKLDISNVFIIYIGTLANFSFIQPTNPNYFDIANS